MPFLLGGLGDYLGADQTDTVYYNYPYVNDALKKIADKMDCTGFVSAKGLTCNPDRLHFNSESLYKFGLRYYKEFLKYEDKNKIFVEKATMDSFRTKIEGI